MSVHTTDRDMFWHDKKFKFIKYLRTVKSIYDKYSINIIDMHIEYLLQVYKIISESLTKILWFLV